jgi:DNA topoisomerase-3
VALFVAEKPSVAKSIAEILSQGRFNKSMGKSKYNPIFEFDYEVANEPVRLKVTSVLGHIMGLSFPMSCKNWQETNMMSLY